jgi:hypothetical protein
VVDPETLASIIGNLRGYLEKLHILDFTQSQTGRE